LEGHAQALNWLRITSALALADPGNLTLSPSCMSSVYKTAQSLKAAAATQIVRISFGY
jgi:hypothetical protein